MTNEEHIEQLKKLRSFHNGSYGRSINKAIDVLKQEPCTDAVSRQAIKEKKIYSEERHEYIVPIAYIDWLPSVTPTRPKGKWMQTNDFIINLDGQFIYKFICSECKSLSYFRTSNKKAIGANVCPNCGADMREGE